MIKYEAKKIEGFIDFSELRPLNEDAQKLVDELFGVPISRDTKPIQITIRKIDVNLYDVTTEKNG